MKTAIIGLPMVGKTSLFTILTGVHQETAIGSTAARDRCRKVPDARLDALARLFEPPKITYATVEYLDMPSISKENAARSQLSGQPARGGRLRPRAAAVRGSRRCRTRRARWTRCATWKTWRRS